MRLLICSLLLGLSISDLLAERFYVNASASPGGDGASWATAHQYLQDALDQTIAGRGDEVWIAAGIYYPDDGANVTDGDRTASFTIKDDVALYGGFVGTETDRSERDWETNITTLSGKIFADQAYYSLHVCTVQVSASVTLDGITITGGNANGSGTGGNQGAAIYSTGTNYEVFAMNCSFKENTASSLGGVGAYGTWDIRNCNFNGNSALTGGVAYGGTWNVHNSNFHGNGYSANFGGVASSSNWNVSGSVFSQNSALLSGVCDSGTWDVANSIFIGNSASQKGGVAGNSTWEVSNSLFIGNSAEWEGGVARNCVWTVVNCSFAGNSAPSGGTVAHAGSWMVMNSIFDSTNASATAYIFERMSKFQNTTESAPSPLSLRAVNIIQGGLGEIHMENSATPDLGSGFVLDTNPLFVNSSDPDGPDNEWGTADDGYRLMASSPAINQGNIAFLPQDIYDLDNDGVADEDLPVDLAGFLRVQDDTLDLGAYEYGDASAQLYTVNVQSSIGGTTEPSGSQNYSLGALIEIVPVPAPGYLFDSWSGDASGSVNPLPLTIDQNLSITANFTPDLADPDEDGLSNFQELVTYGTNPNLKDSSGDGLADGDVVSTGFDPTTDFSALISLLENQLEDARTGSTMIDVSGNNAILQLQVERSQDLIEWCQNPEDIIEVQIPLSEEKGFFRFSMPTE